MVRANLSQVVIGNTNRATESRHATGAEAEIPDISEYSRGRKGYFQIWDPQAKEITARGRTFLLGVPPDELAYCKRIVDARKGTRRVLPGPDLVLDAPRGHARGERVPGEHAPEAAAPGVSEMRARLAAARAASERTPPRRQSRAAGRRPAARGYPAGRCSGPAGAARRARGHQRGTGGRGDREIEGDGLEVPEHAAGARYRRAGDRRAAAAATGSPGSPCRSRSRRQGTDRDHLST